MGMNKLISNLLFVFLFCFVVKMMHMISGKGDNKYQIYWLIKLFVKIKEESKIALKKPFKKYLLLHYLFILWIYIWIENNR